MQDAETSNWWITGNFVAACRVDVTEQKLELVSKCMTENQSCELSQNQTKLVRPGGRNVHFHGKFSIKLVTENIFSQN